MAWTYSGNPKASPKDMVRFLIADTNPKNPQVSDEEIGAFLDQEIPDAYESATKCLQYLLTKAAQEVDIAIGQQKVFASQKYERIKQMLVTLQGQSKLDVQRVPSRGVFKMGQFDNRYSFEGYGPDGFWQNY